MEHQGKCARVLCSAALLCATATALQVQPLPESIKATAWGIYADRIYPSSNAADIDNLSAQVRYYTDDQLITFEWRIRAEGALMKKETEAIPLSFAPTAVCTERGIGPTVYVAGYIERTGHVVVERWTFDDMVLGAAVPAGGGTPISTFSKTLRKSVVVMTQDLEPLKAIVFNAPADRLWVFEEEPPYVVSSIDTESGDIDWLFDWTIVPALALTHTAVATMIESPAPLSGGFLIRLEPWRPWARWPHLDEADEAAEQVYILRDANLDGTIDESAILTVGEYEARGWWEYGNALYQ